MNAFNFLFRSAFYVLVMGILLTALPAQGQDLMDEVRFSVAATKNWKLNKHFRLNAGQTVQWRHAMPPASLAKAQRDSSLWSSLRSISSLGLQYRLSREFRLAAGSQFFGKPGTNMNRVFVDLSYAHKLSKTVRWQTRLRTQRDISVAEGVWGFNDRLRFRTRIQFRGVVRPFADAEIMYRLDGRRKGWDRLWAHAGLDVPVGDHSIRAAYRYQYRFGRKNPSLGLLMLSFAFQL